MEWKMVDVTLPQELSPGARHSHDGILKSVTGAGLSVASNRWLSSWTPSPAHPVPVCTPTPSKPLYYYLYQLWCFFLSFQTFTLLLNPKKSHLVIYLFSSFPPLVAPLSCLDRGMHLITLSMTFFTYLSHLSVPAQLLQGSLVFTVLACKDNGYVLFFNYINVVV